MSEEEFEFLKLKRVEFLRRVGYFGERGSKGREVGKKEAVGRCVNEDLKRGRDRHTPCYEPTNIEATRDSLFWSWRRVSEYYRDLQDLEDCSAQDPVEKIKEVIRIDPLLRKR